MINHCINIKYTFNIDAEWTFSIEYIHQLPRLNIYFKLDENEILKKHDNEFTRIIVCVFLSFFPSIYFNRK